MRRQHNDYDIAVIGGGPAGLSFARLMSGTGLRLLVVEKKPAAALKKPVYDGREIALTHPSYKVMENMGLWDEIPRDAVTRIIGAKAFNGDLTRPLSFDAGRAGKENLGYMVSNQNIQKAVFAAVSRQKNVTLATETSVTRLATDDSAAMLQFDDGRRVTARLAIAADSRFSEARGMMGIAASRRDFGRSAIVCRMSLEHDHDGIARECFFYDRTLAVLPLGPKSCSVVLTVAHQETAAVMAQSPKEFSADIEQRISHAFGKMKLSSALFNYPLVGVFADNFHARRFCLIGDASVGMHPVTAHGFNLGLQGAASLAHEIKQAQRCDIDFASDETLARYSRRHRAATLPMYYGTNLLVSVFTDTTKRGRMTRKLFMSLGRGLPFVRQIIAGKLTGD
ncbi:MAG: 5-demethoxyubiquinol-8 5-hydroxylase UbiM [Alphaproteobacteria bacterium]|nr:5-demethoxyubiquinol-8 5-hydroxylase UbiM [Alphaproteobacteria bacterium]